MADRKNGLPDKINIMLVGYGKMGKIIHENADFIKGEVVAICDPSSHEISDGKPVTIINSIDMLSLENVDVAIEFTHPKCGFENVKKLLDHKIPVVTGTTGWFHLIDELKGLFDPTTHTLIYGANFSVGMNIFYQIVAESVKRVDQTGLYDVYGYESHHRHKADSPSGTARTLSGIILENISDKDKVVFDLNGNPLHENEFSFASVRAGNIIGYHEIGFDADFDEIKLVHNAKNRKGFAIGALMAARYAVNQKGFMDFKDVFDKAVEGIGWRQK